ncbi:hypothetical protein BU000_14220 [Mammaliicoccus sciuri]|nr:hypothetical protein BU000_14220 [Mammaliicoccus sciuri]
MLMIQLTMKIIRIIQKNKILNQKIIQMKKLMSKLKIAKVHQVRIQVVEKKNSMMKKVVYH